MSQDADVDGRFEADAAVEWVDNGDEVAFTLTEELAAACDSYICTVHGSMRGQLETTDADDGPSSEIEDWNDLDAIRENLDGDYVLVNDLDEETAGYDEHVGDPEDGFEPLGSGDDPFTGTFDGQENDIDGLVIDRPVESGVGLFGAMSEEAELTDVGVINVDVTGNEIVGGLVGENGGTIEGCYTTGELIGTDGGRSFGGLVGDNFQGRIENSHSAADVTAEAGTRVGGLVGNNLFDGEISSSHATGTVAGETAVGGLVGLSEDAEISSSHATGTVSGESRRVGGLVGVQFQDEITMSYATGDVAAAGANEVGGLVGENIGTISESFATGSVGGSNTVGGLVGEHSFGEVTMCFADTAVEAADENAEIGGFVGNLNAGETISQSYALGSVEAEDARSLGGFAGESNGDITECYAAVEVSGSGTEVGGFIAELEGSLPEGSYWDTEVSGQSESPAAIGLSTDEMQGNDAAENMAALDFDETWDVVTDPDDYPILQFQDEPDPTPAPDLPEEWTERGLSDEQFEAVTDADGELGREEMRNAFEAYFEPPAQEIDGVAVSRDDMRNIFQFYFDTV